MVKQRNTTDMTLCEQCKKQIGTQCVYVSTEVLEKLARCDPCDTYCTSVATSVFERHGGGCIKKSPDHMQLKYVNDRQNVHRTPSHIRCNFVTSENIRL